MQDTLALFIKSHRLFNVNDPLILAVSGGADSTLLCHLLKDLGYHATLAHCNFGLRGTESDADEKFVENLAHDLGFEFKCIKFSTKEEATRLKKGIQETARILRYNWFEELHKANDAYVLTAHHLSDNLETVMINWMRGSGNKGLGGIPIERNWIRRPLMCFTSYEIRRYCMEENISYRNDSSNDNDQYLRNKLRHHVIPAWKKLSDNLEQISYRNADLIRKQAMNWESHLSSAFHLTDEKEEITIPNSILNNYPHPDVVLYDIIGKYGFSADQCKQIIGQAKSESGAYIQAGNKRLYRDRNQFVLNALQHLEPLVVDREGDYAWHNCILEVRVIAYKDVAFSNNFEVFLDHDCASFPLQICEWNQSDRMQVLGMKGSKLLSDLFIDAKIPQPMKSKLAVLKKDDDILWVQGIQISEKTRISKDSKDILHIKTIYI
jgi:tRNA(Ile)-lysidine synthase